MTGIKIVTGNCLPVYLALLQNMVPQR